MRAGSRCAGIASPTSQQVYGHGPERQEQGCGKFSAKVDIGPRKALWGHGFRTLEPRRSNLHKDFEFSSLSMGNEALQLHEAG